MFPRGVPTPPFVGHKGLRSDRAAPCPVVIVPCSWTCNKVFKPKKLRLDAWSAGAALPKAELHRGGVGCVPPRDHLSLSALPTSSTAPRGCPPSTSPTASAPSAASRSSWTSTRRGSSRTRTASPATTCILLLRASAVPLPSSQHPGARVGDAGRCQRILVEGTFWEQSAAPVFWQGSGSVCLVELLPASSAPQLLRQRRVRSFQRPGS